MKIKHIIYSLILMFFLSNCKSENKDAPKKKYNSVADNVKNVLIDIYAGPFNKFGTSVKVYSEFGKNSGCKIEVFENNTNGNIFLQIKRNSNVEWEQYTDGDFISAQVIYCRATSTNTGGNIKIKVY